MNQLNIGAYINKGKDIVIFIIRIGYIQNKYSPANEVLKVTVIPLDTQNRTYEMTDYENDYKDNGIDFVKKAIQYSVYDSRIITKLHDSLYINRHKIKKFIIQNAGI